MIRFSLIFLIAVLGICPGMAQLGRGADDPTREQSQGPLVPLRITNHPARILWDTSHGVLLEYEPSGNYSDLVALLAAKGQVVEASDAGVLNLDLSLYTTLVVCLASNWDRPYSDAEADRIYDWVRNGGNLLIKSDNDLTPNENIANVAGRFGVTFTDVPLFPSVLYLEHFSSHPEMAGLSQIFIPAGGDHLIEPPMEAAAWDPTGRIVVSVGQFGGGHVVVVGDSSCWSNEVLDAVDNQLFAENVFDALTVATVPTLSTPYLIFFIMGLVGLALILARSHRKREHKVPSAAAFKDPLLN